MSWAAILILAAGAYGFKALGLLVLGPLANRSGSSGTAEASETAGSSYSEDGVEPTGGVALQLGQLLPPALLAALVVNQTVSDGQELVLDARLAGVVAGAIAVWRGAPFWLVILVAAAVAGGLRAVTG